jgi:hypothetical protein
MTLIEIFQKYADPLHTGCFSFWHEAAPHIVYDLDAAEGVRFWSMNSDADDLDEAQFGAASIFSDGWQIKIENGAYVNIEMEQAGVKKVTAMPYPELPAMSPMVKAAEEFMRTVNEEIARLCCITAGSINGYVTPKPDDENEFQTIVLGSTDHPMLSEAGATVFAPKPTPKASDQVIKFFEGAIGCVEANSFERMCIYRNNDKASDSWKDSGEGYGAPVGDVLGKPVYISLNSAVVNGHKVIFYYPTSVMVDHNLILDWMRGNMPETAFKNDRLNTVDAMNFHNVLPRG